MTSHETPRESERRPLSLMVKSRVHSRAVYVDLIDISEGGCKIKGTCGFVELGDRVLMNIGGLNAPVGTIAWVEGRIAGVNFEGKMHSAVLDHLCTDGDANPEKQRLHRI